MTQQTLPMALPDGPRRFREPILREAEVDGPYRWTMKRAWGGGPLLHWCLLNPSTADDKKDDPTTLRMMNFSADLGFGSMVVTNVYPFITPWPSELRKWRATFNHKSYEHAGMPPWELFQSSWAAFHHGLGKTIEAVTAASLSIAAWGAGVPKADLQQLIEGALIEVYSGRYGSPGAKIKWACLGKNADGSPRHPLARGRSRIQNGAKMQPWP